MRLLCYTFSVIYIFWIVYKNMWQFVIQQDIVQVKGTTLLVSGYIVLPIYVV